nr:hypothetical protein [uncultured Rhodopila sp.]
MSEAPERLVYNAPPGTDSAAIASQIRESLKSEPGSIAMAGKVELWQMDVVPREPTRFELLRDMKPLCELAWDTEVLLVPHEECRSRGAIVRGRMVKLTPSDTGTILRGPSTYCSVSDFIGWLPMDYNPGSIVKFPTPMRRIELSEGERVVLKYPPGTSVIGIRDGYAEHADNHQTAVDILAAIRAGDSVAIPDGWELTVLSRKQAEGMEAVETPQPKMPTHKTLDIVGVEAAADAIDAIVSRADWDGTDKWTMIASIMRDHLGIEEKESPWSTVTESIEESIRRLPERLGVAQTVVNSPEAVAAFIKAHNIYGRIDPVAIYADGKRIDVYHELPALCRSAGLHFPEELKDAGFLDRVREVLRGIPMEQDLLNMPPTRTVGVNAEATSNAPPAPVGREPGFKATTYQRSDLFPAFRSLPLNQIRIEHCRRPADHLPIETFLDDDGKWRVLEDPTGERLFMNEGT